MKFPYELSEQRLSLLSDDDRILYEYEHSPFYSYEDKVRSINEYNQGRYGRYQDYYNQINEDEDFSDLSEEEKEEMSKQLTNLEIIEIYDNFIEPLVQPILLETMTDEEYNKIKNASLKQMYNMPIVNEAVAINETGTAPGVDQTFWIPNMGWLGAIAGGILTTGLAGMIGLFMAGKDKAAAKALEKYMRKLVETVDMGLYKKKSFWNWLGGKFGSKSKGTQGDQSRACFRNIQELVERKMCTDILVAGKACGFFGNDPINDALSHNVESGGLNLLFKEKIADKINTFIVK